MSRRSVLQPVGKARGRRLARARFDTNSAAAIFHTLQRQFAHWRARLLHNLHNAWAERGIIAKISDKERARRAAERARRRQQQQDEVAEAAGGEPIDTDTDIGVGVGAGEAAGAAEELSAGSAALRLWIDDVIDDAIDEPSAASMRDVADAMARAQVGAANHTIRQIDLDDPSAIMLRINTKAVDYAAARAAEMVGKRYDANGNLIDNPDADWAITDTARDVLRREIRDAVALHWGPDKLADRIEETGLFSDARAEMIARTEINMAQNQGVLEAGRQARDAGADVRKVWTLGDNPCPQCEDAAAEGDIDLDDDFGSDAGDSPPLHPNCECSLDLIVADDEEEEEPEEEEAKMQDLKAATRKRFEQIFKDDVDVDDEETNDDGLGDDENDNGNGNNGQRHLVDQLADLLVEAGSGDGPVSREDALRYLLHSERGQALVARMAQARKQQTNKGTANMDATIRIAKSIADSGRSWLTEHELTAKIEQYALRERRAGETLPQAFSRVFSANTVEGNLFRKAVQIAKAAQLEIMPVQVGGDDVNVNDAEKAYTQLQRLADEQRRRSPDLTEEQAFARAFKENPALARRAHRRPAATTSFPFPR
jgi:hypothetical protein